MTKVHPNAPPAAAVESPSPSPSPSPSKREGKEEGLTVWRKSLLFNCAGFTVFDGRGDLRFRVDSYSSGRRAEVVLMDAAGKSLFTIRRKRLSLCENWMIYDGDDEVHPLYSVKKHMTLLPSRDLAHVTPCRARSAGRRAYVVEGSYTQRKCTIYDDLSSTVAEVRQKEAPAGVTLGGDVFRLVIQPGSDSPLVMAMVIALEQMYGA